MCFVLRLLQFKNKIEWDMVWTKLYILDAPRELNQMTQQSNMVNSVRDFC